VQIIPLIGRSVRLGQATGVEDIDIDDEERAFNTAGYTGKVGEWFHEVD
jgi:hypothetical protein